MRVDEWRDIPGYGGKYQVTYEGSIRRVYKKSGKTRLLRPYQKKMKGSDRYVVKLTKDGKPKEVVFMQVIAQIFLGECPAGYIPIHKNGIQSDNCAGNIVYLSKQEAGKLTGGNSHRKPVAKLDKDGNVVEFYSSAREAARENFMSYQTVIDRCNGKTKSLVAPDGYIYSWDDERRIRGILTRIKKQTGG